MKKIQKLFLTGGLFSNILFFNQAHSQEKGLGTSEKGGTWTQGQYQFNRKTYSNKYEITDDKMRTWTRYYNVNKNNPTIITSATSWQISDKPQNSTNSQNYNKTYLPKNNKTNLGNVLNTTNDVLNTALILNELFKPRQKNYVSPTQPIIQPINKSPSEIYNESKKSSSSPRLEEKTKKSENWWKEEQKNKLKEQQENNWWEEDKLKSENLLEKKVKYSPETKKKLEEEAKISDEYFKEIGMNPGAQVKYKVVGTAEIGPNGELIKKDSFSPEREMTDEEKVILYYAYQTMKKDPIAGSVMEGVEIMNNPEKIDEFFKEKGMNPGAQTKYKVLGTAEISPDGKLIKKDSYSPARELTDEEKVVLYYTYKAMENNPLTGPVIKGVETINKLEKDVDFLFVKPIGDNTYSYFKLAGKENYFVMKDSPSGNSIMNVANFKEKTEKSVNFWDE